MKAIYKAIMDEYAANTNLVAALVGGLHLQLQEQQTVNQPPYPYATFFKVTQVPEYTFSELGENTIIQFDIFDNSTNVATISDAATYLKTCFDLADLTVSGYNHILMMREWETEPIPFDEVRQISIQYRLIIQKTR
jgi:hypothetical protein